MRPNIDIDHSTHGCVKDYAEDHDIDDLSEAYTRLLEEALPDE